MLSQQFHMMDLGQVNYFLGLEISLLLLGSSCPKKKYTLDLINEYGLSNTTPLKIPMDSHLKLTPTKGTILPNLHPYERLLEN